LKLGTDSEDCGGEKWKHGLGAMIPDLDSLYPAYFMRKEKKGLIH
jgi:hypothetical protein